MKNFFKNRFGLTLGFLWILILVSCQSQNSNVSSILSQSIEKVIGCDSLSFFPPLILSDGATDSENNITRANYNKLKRDYLKIQKYVIIPDSVIIDYENTQKSEVININKLSLKHFYDLVPISKLGQLKKPNVILATFTQINIQINDSKDKGQVTYKVKCHNAEHGGWEGKLRLHKNNKRWSVEVF